MLEIQKYLFGHTLEELKSEFGIDNRICKYDNRVILDYSQIDSYKCRSHPIVREARGLILENHTWKLIAKSFNRFFSLGDIDTLDWTQPVIVTEKLDGSLINIYYYNGWRVNTRFSFADSYVNDTSLTWKDLVAKHINFDMLDENKNYIFELSGPYNKIVIDYPELLTLLSVFECEEELPFDMTEIDSLFINVPIVAKIDVSSEEEMYSYLNTLNKHNIDCEGFVLRDCNDVRAKVKHEKYVKAHILANNRNAASPKNLVPLIMGFETDDMLALPCMKYLQETVKEYKKKIDDAWREIDDCWYCFHDEKNMKRFVKAVEENTKHSWPLFQAKRGNKHPKDFFDVDYVLKNVFNV